MKIAHPVVRRVPSLDLPRLTVVCGEQQRRRQVNGGVVRIEQPIWRMCAFAPVVVEAVYELVLRQPAAIDSCEDVEEAPVHAVPIVRPDCLARQPFAKGANADEVVLQRARMPWRLLATNEDDVIARAERRPNIRPADAPRSVSSIAQELRRSEEARVVAPVVERIPMGVGVEITTQRWISTGRFLGPSVVSRK